MQLIKFSLIIISLFLLLFVESFLLRLFSFSAFIIVLFLLWGRVRPMFFYLFVAIFTIALDTVLHTPLGTHAFVVSLLLIISDFLWLIIPRDGRFGFVTIFLLFLLYYLLVPTFALLFEDFALSNLPKFNWIGIIISSAISVGVYMLFGYFMKFFRSERSESKIRLA